MIIGISDKNMKINHFNTGHPLLIYGMLSIDYAMRERIELGKVIFALVLRTGLKRISNARAAQVLKEVLTLPS